MGQSPPSNAYNADARGVPFYQGNADFGTRHPKTRIWCDAPTKIAHAGDILLSVRAPIGALNIATETCCIGRGLAGLTANPEKIDTLYLYYVLQSKTHILSALGTGSTFKAVSKAIVSEFPMPIYPLEKQKHIASVLDTIERSIDNIHQQSNSLDELVKSQFVELFGDLAFNPHTWKTIPLVDACTDRDDIKCGPFGTQLGKHEYIKEGIPLWGIPQINASFSTPPTDFITEKKSEQLEAYSILPGDIAMSRKGNVGKCAIYPQNFSRGIIHSDVLRIRLNHKICNPYFMMHQLHFSRAVESQIDAVSSGAVMAGINVTKLKNTFVHIPPLTLQNEFAAFVEQVDKSEFITQILAIFLKKYHNNTIEALGESADTWKGARI